jgi:leucyl aminopeptidase
MAKVTQAGSDFDPTPSTGRFAGLTVRVESSVPAGSGAVGVLVGVGSPVPDALTLDRATLAASGFEAKPGQALLIPRQDGPSLVAVGIGDPARLKGKTLRDAAAAFARAAGRHARLAMAPSEAMRVNPEIAGQVLVEGILLARYHYDALKNHVAEVDLAEVILVADAGSTDALARGAERGRVFAAASALARDLANTPPAHLTATRMAEVAAVLAAERGLGVEIFDRDALVELGCGGLLAVNAGSVEPPRMIKLGYRPASGAADAGHLILVGKGVTYDSGGISLKPSDDAHATMKVDMSGAGAVLAAMAALPALGCPTRVTGYLMCTDNMPSGSAMKMGDVLTIHGGKTVEIFNTDAEGRLAMADALDLAVAERPDAIVDIATLTGACLRALGDQVAGVFGNRQALVDQVIAAAGRTGEPVWQLPLDQRYRKQLDSTIADMKNIGGDFAGAITAALFLAEFVDDVPWAHLDIAGVAHSSAEDAWRRKGGTGYGARLLIDLALNFTRPHS